MGIITTAFYKIVKENFNLFKLAEGKMETIIFDENCFSYGQDMGSHIGIPTDVEFSIKEFGCKDKVSLIAPGYGGKPYGNGAIFIDRELLDRGKLCAETLEIPFKVDKTYKKNSGIWWLMEQDEEKVWTRYLIQSQGIKFYSRSADIRMADFLRPVCTFAGCHEITADIFKKYRSLKSREGSPFKWVRCNLKRKTNAEKVVEHLENAGNELIELMVRQDAENEGGYTIPKECLGPDKPDETILCPYCRTWIPLNVKHSTIITIKETADGTTEEKEN